MQGVGGSSALEKPPRYDLLNVLLPSALLVLLQRAGPLVLWFQSHIIDPLTCVTIGRVWSFNHFLPWRFLFPPLRFLPFSWISL